MKINIYQIDLDKDTNGVAFESYDRLAGYQGTQNSGLTKKEILDLYFDEEDVEYVCEHPDEDYNCV